MQRLRAYIATFLVMVLATTVIPREVWHHCSDELASGPHATHQESAVTKLCDLCKLQATVFTQSLPVAIPSPVTYPIAPSTAEFTAVFVSPLHLLPQRAPPVA